MGIFHAQNAPHLGFKIAAFLVPLAIQIGRGTLVFFFQLNPARIQSRFSMGIIAATTLLLLSLWEAYLVMSAYGLSWTVSVSTLMLIGWVIEIMILKETMFATQMALYQNKEQWKELHDFYIARNDFDQFMDDLYDGKKPNLPLKEGPLALKGEAKADDNQLELEFSGKRAQLVSERADLVSATFYGVKLDIADPFLFRNLSRLEARFRTRYYSSVQKEKI